MRGLQLVLNGLNLGLQYLFCFGVFGHLLFDRPKQMSCRPVPMECIGNKLRWRVLKRSIDAEVGRGEKRGDNLTSFLVKG